MTCVMIFLCAASVGLSIVGAEGEGDGHISKDCNCHWHPFGLLSRCGNVRPDLWDYAEGLKIAPL